MICYKRRRAEAGSCNNCSRADYKVVIEFILAGSSFRLCMVCALDLMKDLKAEWRRPIIGK